jgi:hypothetical protein
VEGLSEPLSDASEREFHHVCDEVEARFHRPRLRINRIHIDVPLDHAIARGYDCGNFLHVNNAEYEITDVEDLSDFNKRRCTLMLVEGVRKI